MDMNASKKALAEMNDNEKAELFLELFESSMGMAKTINDMKQRILLAKKIIHCSVLHKDYIDLYHCEKCGYNEQDWHNHPGKAQIKTGAYCDFEELEFYKQ